MLAPELHLPLFVALDEAANNSQRAWRRRYVRSLLGLGAIAVVIELGEVIQHYSGLKDDSLRFALMALVGFGVGGLLYEVRYAVRHHHRFGRWIHVRAVAEQVKSHAWLALVGADAPLPAPDAHASNDWRSQAQHIIDGGAAPALGPLLATEGLQIARRKFAHLPLDEQAAHYRSERIAEQHQYFTSRAARIERRTRFHHRIMLALLFFAIGWGVLRALSIWFESKVVFGITPLEHKNIFQVYNMVPVLVAVVALLKAYVETEKIDSLLARYRNMAVDLAEHLAAPAPTAPAALQEWVHRVEKLLLAQTKEWQLQRRE